MSHALASDGLAGSISLDCCSGASVGNLSVDNPVTSRAALLHVLTLGAGTGAQLNARIQERTRGKLTLNPNALYPTLRRMESEGAVQAEQEDRQRRYSLTAKGRQEARATQELVRSFFAGE